MGVLPYRETTDAAYADTAAATFTASTPAAGVLMLTGPCPRCATVIQIPVVDGVYKGLRLRRREPAPTSPTPRVEPMICTCEEPHEGRPADRIGCGAYWLLELTAARA
jgi:hypothetical protein